jgi:6-phosphofructokinase 1
VETDCSAELIANAERAGIDAIIAIGGDGTLGIALELVNRGLKIVGVPKTIDNDIPETTNCFGFDSAVAFATEAIDRLHTTAESHRRLMVVEVMGRYAGWIGLYAGVAGGADVILIPEIPYHLERVAEHIRTRERLGARFSIVVAAEGAKPIGGSASVIKEAEPGAVERLGGVGARLAMELEARTGKETRWVVLGHLQRGGAPTSFDRVLATRFGAKAFELVAAGEFGQMVALRPPDIVAVPLDRIVGRTKNVPLDSDVVRAARAVGIAFGD